MLLRLVLHLLPLPAQGVSSCLSSEAPEGAKSFEEQRHCRRSLTCSGSPWGFFFFFDFGWCETETASVESVLRILVFPGLVMYHVVPLVALGSGHRPGLPAGPSVAGSHRHP